MRITPRILVVDDDADLRNVISLALQRAGYTVFAAASGAEALEKLGVVKGARSDETPTILVMDVRMPGMSGMQVLASLWLRCEAVPVVLMTAFPDQQGYALARALGAVTLLAKPFAMDDLRAVVDALA